LEFFEFRSHAGADGDCTQKNAGNFGKDAFVFLSPIVGAVGVGLRGRENQIEEAHGDDVAKFRIRHTNEDSNRLVDLEKSGFFRGKLCWSYGLAHGMDVQRGPTDNGSSCRGAGRFADTAWRGGLCRTTYRWTAFQRFSELGHAFELLQGGCVNFRLLAVTSRSGAGLQRVLREPREYQTPPGFQSALSQMGIVAASHRGHNRGVPTVRAHGGDDRGRLLPDQFCRD